MSSALSPASRAAINDLCRHYPSRLAALLPSLHLVQAEHGYLPAALQAEVAEVLGIPVTRVHEVVSFYTMFHETPKGRHRVRICRNLPCQLRGADKIIACAKAKLGIELGETTADGRVSLDHEECLASCGTGPMLWCNDTLVENLTEEKLVAYLDGLA